MSMSSIAWNPAQQQAGGVSKLQTFGNVMGILSALGSLSSMGQKMYQGFSNMADGASSLGNEQFLNLTNDLLKQQGGSQADPFHLGSLNSPQAGGMVKGLDLYKNPMFTGFTPGQSKILDPNLYGGR
jgi:hypothetical protein